MNTANSTLWVKKYAPETISDCILPSSYRETFSGLIDRGETPNMLIHSNGETGVGKTSLVKALNNDLKHDVLWINASTSPKTDFIKNGVASFVRTSSFEGKQKVVVLDNAELFSKTTSQPNLCRIMDDSPKSSFILIASDARNILRPLKSRCMLFNFKLTAEEKSQRDTMYLKRAFEILKKEGISFEDKDVAQVVKAMSPDFRSILNELHRLGASGQLQALQVAA